MVILWCTAHMWTCGFSNDGCHGATFAFELKVTNPNVVAFVDISN